MNVPLIQETPSAAREKLREYRKALHAHADREYAQLAEAYVQLAKGRALIRLTEAFATAPLDEKGRVRLAIAPATMRQVRLAMWNDNRWAFTSLTRSGLHSRWRASILDERARSRSPDGYALVPIVPPNVRGTYRLERCCVLWEIEAWANEAIRATPSADPLLIRRIGDDLYAVLGEWLATPLESAIAAGRRLA